MRHPTPYVSRAALAQSGLVLQPQEASMSQLTAHLGDRLAFTAWGGRNA